MKVVNNDINNIRTIAGLSASATGGPIAMYPIMPTVNNIDTKKVKVDSLMLHPRY